MALVTMTLDEVLTSIFSKHTVHEHQSVIYGQGTIENETFYILGTTEHTFLGVDESLVLAEKLLEILAKKDTLPVVLLVDVVGQKLAMRDEWLGQYAYFAHLLECMYLVRAKGHRVLSLVYNQAIGGSFLAFGAMADKVYALSHATIAVMWLDAMAKVTKIDKSILIDISKTSPIFAPGANNFKKLGAVNDVLDLKDVAKQFLKDLTISKVSEDKRSFFGYQLGGRTHAYPIIEKIKAL